MVRISQATIERTLRAHGVKPTPQRIEIGELLLAQPRHMSADQILNALRAAGSRSLVTGDRRPVTGDRR
jgi:Fur family iron response transcriptional regulator